jgi:hypothetical protein
VVSYPSGGLINPAPTSRKADPVGSEIIDVGLSWFILLSADGYDEGNAAKSSAQNEIIRCLRRMRLCKRKRIMPHI